MTVRKKLILIRPISKIQTRIYAKLTGRFIKPKYVHPPLELGYIAALTPDHWDIEIIDERVETASFKECDLVGITAFTATINRAYEIAHMFRERKIPVVMGGIHVSMLPDEALQFVDSVVIGEAESVWAEVIADVESNNLKPKYYGTRTDLKGLILPRRDLFYKGYKSSAIQTTRGCPMDCEFCSVSTFSGREFRQRPVDEVIEELKTIDKKIVFFMDDNIMGYGPKNEEWAISLAKGMVEANLKIQWFSQSAMNVADNEEVLYWFRKSGCRFLFLGMESDDPDTLRAWNKKVNINRSYEEVFRKMHKHGIGVWCGFILGADGDNMENVQHHLDFMKSSHIDVVSFQYLTPYPGTRLFDRTNEEGKLLYTNFPYDWELYGITEVMFNPDGRQIAEYDEMIAKTIQELFSHKLLFKQFIRTWRDTKSPVTALVCYAMKNGFKKYYTYSHKERLRLIDEVSQISGANQQ